MKFSSSVRLFKSDFDATTGWRGVLKGFLHPTAIFSVADDADKAAKPMEDAANELIILAAKYNADIKSIDKTFSADDVDALNEYLTAINSSPGAMTSNLKIQWVGKPTFSDAAPDAKVAAPAVKAIMKLPGDPTAGEKVFSQSCGTCHTIKDRKIGPPMVKAAQDMNNVAQTVRFGSSAMAFYAKDVLSDQQIADAIAYIQSAMGK